MASGVGEDLTRGLIDALLAPVLAALDRVDGTDREWELSQATLELFALDDT